MRLEILILDLQNLENKTYSISSLCLSKSQSILLIKVSFPNDISQQLDNFLSDKKEETNDAIGIQNRGKLHYLLLIMFRVIVLVDQPLLN